MIYFKRYLPDHPIIENDDFVIYGKEDLDCIKQDLITLLSKKKVELLKFFQFSSFKKVSIHLFSSRENYLKFSKQFFEPSVYSRANHAGGMINLLYPIGNLKKDLFHFLAFILHEYVHLLYQSIYKEKQNRTVWLDEGLAQYLSGEASLLKKDEKQFRAWYLDRIIRRDKEIPKIEFLKQHGNHYGQFIDGETGKYSGYDLSYLLVRYIIEQKDIISLLYDKRKIEELEPHILQDCITYYNRYFQVDYIKNFNTIQTPNELMDYMNLNIVYGWVDHYQNIHENNLRGVRNLYRTSSIDEILITKVGTCIEQAKLIQFFLNYMKIENKLYCYRKYETDESLDEKVKMHCFVLYHNQGKWFHFEHTNSLNRGIHPYETLEAAIEAEINRHEPDDIRQLSEIPEIPDGLTFLEFNQYVNQFSTIKKIGICKK